MKIKGGLSGPSYINSTLQFFKFWDFTQFIIWLAASYNSPLVFQFLSNWGDRLGILIYSDIEGITF